MSAINEFLAAIPKPVYLGLAGVGALYLGSHLLSSIYVLLNIFVLSGANLRKYGPKGSWAVITGASDGLGKEFATQLAAKGFNIVLVSRTRSKLETVASELESKFSGLQTKVLDIDFSAPKDTDFERLAQLVDGLDVAILINNVGQSHSMPTPFLLTEQKEMENIVTINVMGTLKVTKAVAPGMEKRKRGLILTMGSFSAFSPTPYLATYAGSKAFLWYWSTALAAELKASKVDVQLCLGYLIVGAMAKIRRPSLLIPNQKPFVKSALSKVGTGGWLNMAYTYVPYWSHAVMAFAIERVLGTGSVFTLDYNLKMHKDIRTRAIRKAEREAKKN